MSIRIHAVDARADLRAFLSVPRRVYAGDAAYVAPLRLVRRRRLVRAGALRPDSRLQLFVAYQDGEPVGCISVMRDRKHDRHKAESVAFAGFFDTIDDAGVAGALLDAASDQARAWGAPILRGPRNLTRIDETGVLVEGHGRAPMLAGHHPAWYQGYFEDSGFTKHHDVLAYETHIFDADGRERPLPARLQERADAVDIDGLEIRSADYCHIWRDLDCVHEVMVDAFRDVPENTPIDRRQVRVMGAGLLGVTNRHMLQLATVDGQAAAFALCFPELNEALIYARGRVDPLAAGRFAVGLRRIRTASFKLLGVMPAFRSTGLHARVIQHAIEGVKRAGYERLEASLIDERNGPMRHIVESAGMEIYRRYRVYERAL